jgi:hypothetical protein
MNFQFYQRERLEPRPTTILNNEIVAQYTKKKIISSDPEDVIHFLNDYNKDFLDPGNESHFEVAQDFLFLTIQMN